MDRMLSPDEIFHIPMIVDMIIKEMVPSYQKYTYNITQDGVFCFAEDAVG